jgi:hypothetical protein
VFHTYEYGLNWLVFLKIYRKVVSLGSTPTRISWISFLNDSKIAAMRNLNVRVTPVPICDIWNVYDNMQGSTDRLLCSSVVLGEEYCGWLAAVCRKDARGVIFLWPVDEANLCICHVSC